MGVIGQACLIIALGLCVYGVGASRRGRAHGRARPTSLSGRRALYALAAVTTSRS